MYKPFREATINYNKILPVGYHRVQFDEQRILGKPRHDITHALLCDSRIQSKGGVNYGNEKDGRHP